MVNAMSRELCIIFHRARCIAPARARLSFVAQGRERNKNEMKSRSYVKRKDVSV